MVPFSRLAILLLLLVSTLSGQQPQPVLEPAKATPAPLPGGTDRQIALDIQVTDKSGVPVRRLQKEDFTLLDEKQPQEILGFHAVDTEAPSASRPYVEVVLVVDAVNASFQIASTERKEVTKFLLANGGKLAHPVSLIFVTTKGIVAPSGSSRDGNAIVALYDHYETGLPSTSVGAGLNGAVERFDRSIKNLTELATYEKGRPGRKLMIWISPGWPLISGPTFGFTRKDYEGMFQSVVALSNELRKARVTLYNVVSLSLASAGGTRANYYLQFLKGASSPSQVQPGYLALQVLAIQTGGRVITATNDLAGAIASCAADADSFYALAFNSRLAGRANEFRTLAVTVNKPGTTVRTRTVYYAQPDISVAAQLKK